MVSLGKDAADFKLAMDRCRRAYLNTNPKHAEKTFESIQISGQPWYRIREESGLPVTWGFHGDYFVAAVGQNAVEGILGRMKSHPPAWWKAIRNQTPVKRRSVVAYLNLHALAELSISRVGPGEQADMRAWLETLGLANATALTHVAGLNGEDCMSKTLPWRVPGA